MLRSWYLIDHRGRRKIEEPQEKGTSKVGFVGTRIDDWPPFSVLVARTDAATLCRALQEVAPTFGADWVVSSRASKEETCLPIVATDSWAAVCEVDAELEERFLGPDVVEAIFGLLARDGVFYGYEPEARTLHLATFERGVLALSWCDSVDPGPSFARQFSRDGRCQQEDPRLFALRALGLPDETAAVDRVAFLERFLAQAGVETWSEALLPVGREVASYVARFRGFHTTVGGAG